VRALGVEAEKQGTNEAVDAHAFQIKSDAGNV
jgi:hypothetical protein